MKIHFLSLFLLMCGNTTSFGIVSENPVIAITKEDVLRYWALTQYAKTQGGLDFFPKTIACFSILLEPSKLMQTGSSYYVENIREIKNNALSGLLIDCYYLKTGKNITSYSSSICDNHKEKKKNKRDRKYK